MERLAQFQLKARHHDEIDNLKIDPTKLTQEQRNQFELFEKLSKEADEYARRGELLNNTDDQETAEVDDEVMLPIKETKWSGQSNLEISRVSTNNFMDLINRPLLATGDVLSFLLFAFIGRTNHHEQLGLLEVVQTSLPFLIPWLIISPFFGSYSRNATSSQSKVLPFVLPSASVSLILACVIRYYEKGYPPPVSFIAISTVITLMFLCGWRGLYIKAFGATTDEDTKEAGFFEVFKMISTLVRRW